MRFGEASWEEEHGKVKSHGREVGSTSQHSWVCFICFYFMFLYNINGILQEKNCVFYSRSKKIVFFF